MNRTMIGLALLVGGIVLLVMGFDASDSLSSEVSKVVNDTPSDRSVWMLILGGMLAVVGLGTVFTGRKG